MPRRRAPARGISPGQTLRLLFQQLFEQFGHQRRVIALNDMLDLAGGDLSFSRVSVVRFQSLTRDLPSAK